MGRNKRTQKRRKNRGGGEDKEEERRMKKKSVVMGSREVREEMRKLEESREKMNR